MQTDIDLNLTGAAVVPTTYLIHESTCKHYKLIYNATLKVTPARSDHAVQPPSQSKCKGQRKGGRLTCAGLGE